MKQILIAELAKVHKGNFQTAKKLIEDAHIAGFNAIKLQYYSKEALIPAHPNYQRNLECWLSIDQILELKKYAENYKMDCWCSFFDEGALQELVGLFKSIKIPSTLFSDSGLVSACIANFDNIHISTGFHTKQDIQSLLSHYKSLSHKRNIIVYHCVSEYPTPDNHLKLERIRTLKMDGFSYHGSNKMAVLYSLLYGAKYIELHFNSMACTSWQWSVPMVQSLIRDIDNLNSMITGDKKEPSKDEKDNFQFYKKEFRRHVVP
jgi:sialic acid synthase SpsE